MTDTRKSLHRGAVRLFAALVPVTLLMGVSPADAESRWLSKPGTRVVGTVITVGIASSLKEHLGELPERFREALDAFSRDDADGIEGAFEESLGSIGKIGLDAPPVLTAATRAGKTARNAVSDATRNLKKRLESAKRSIGRLKSKAGETVADARAALAIDPDERQWYESEARVLDKAPLPSVKVSHTRRAPESSSKSLAEAWGMDAEAIRRSRDPAVWAAKPDPWGPDSGKGWDSPPAPPAAAKVDVWSADAGDGEHGRPGGASAATADPWGQDTGQGWTDASTTRGLVEIVPVDAEWQNEYTTALSHLLGLDDEDSSYEAALSTVERLEREAVERERLAEQQRLEAQERERQARIEAEKRERQARIEAEERERQIARMEAELEGARAERRRRATEQAIIRGVQSAVSALQPMLDSTANRIQQDREARFRRELATLREQARAEQARAAIERQQRQAAEQQRRQAATQARLEQDLRRNLHRCENTRGLLVNECVPGFSTYFECTEENRRIVERHVQSCKQGAWDSYNRSGGGTILGVGRLE